MRLTFLIPVMVLFLSGCAVVSNIPLPLSLVRLPSTVATGDITSPLAADERCRLQAVSDAPTLTFDAAVAHYWSDAGLRLPACRGSSQPVTRNSFDSLEDLRNAETVIFVAASGGGSRAAAMAAHTLSLLEAKFNVFVQQFLPAHADGDRRSALRRIDGFSTVSGGSLYAYALARTISLLDVFQVDSVAPPQIGHGCPGPNVPVNHESAVWHERCLFRHLALQPRFLGIQTSAWNIGTAAGGFYLSPGNAFLGPVVTLTTEHSYLDILAGGLEFWGQPGLRLNRQAVNELHADKKARLTAISGGRFPIPMRSLLDRRSLMTFSALSCTPRFFFNATVLESGLPLVITKRLMHVPTSEIEGGR